MSSHADFFPSQHVKKRKRQWWLGRTTYLEKTSRYKPTNKIFGFVLEKRKEKVFQCFKVNSRNHWTNVLINVEQVAQLCRSLIRMLMCCHRNRWWNERITLYTFGKWSFIDEIDDRKSCRICKKTRKNSLKNDFVFFKVRTTNNGKTLKLPWPICWRWKCRVNLDHRKRLEDKCVETETTFFC